MTVAMFNEQEKVALQILTMDKFMNRPGYMNEKVHLSEEELDRYWPGGEFPIISTNPMPVELFENNDLGKWEPRLFFLPEIDGVHALSGHVVVGVYRPCEIVSHTQATEAITSYYSPASPTSPETTLSITRYSLCRHLEFIEKRHIDPPWAGHVHRHSIMVSHIPFVMTKVIEVVQVKVGPYVIWSNFPQKMREKLEQIPV